MHKEPAFKLAATASKGIDAQLSAHDADQRHRKEMLMKLLQAQDCPEMNVWLRKREYISPEIVSEIIMIMGQSLLRQLLSEVKNFLYFFILVDEATDISHHEQMSVSIRWV